MIIYEDLKFARYRSGETHLKCDRKYYKSFIANSLQTPTAKEFWKLINICRSYEPIERYVSDIQFTVAPVVPAGPG